MWKKIKHIFKHNYVLVDKREVILERVEFFTSMGPVASLVVLEKCSVCGKEKAFYISGFLKQEVNVEYAKSIYNLSYLNACNLDINK